MKAPRQRIGISEVMFCNWKAKYGCLDVSETPAAALVGGRERMAKDFLSFCRRT